MVGRVKTLNGGWERVEADGTPHCDDQTRPLFGRIFWVSRGNESVSKCRYPLPCRVIGQLG